MRAVLYGDSWSVIEIATRGSRARLRAFCDAGWVKKAIRSPSRPTQTATECGAPDGISVATWPKFAPRKSSRTSSLTSAATCRIEARREGEHQAQIAWEGTAPREGDRGGRHSGRRACGRHVRPGNGLAGPEPAVAAAPATAAPHRSHPAEARVALPQGDHALLRRHDQADEEAAEELRLRPPRRLRHHLPAAHRADAQHDQEEPALLPRPEVAD